ncbi:hypothetical protein GCM10009557_43740 [Virgisporangium ochraceum]|uniref:OmpR/PhoB-type domain-containing protein n=2 Tax=Virgisporangium ochraceum TaxID=65505 RepID=A0A8J4ED03_9ACTN|nr:hypothetical protein Voc01_051430 [Virgisporangium ochraceum]
MELRILGPVELLVDGRTVPLLRRQQRLILGILALEANRLVSRTRLITLLWAGSPPPQARAILQSRVSETRSALNDHLDGSSVLLTRDSGYMLTIAPERVDVHRFYALVRDARQSTSDEDVQRLLRKANQLWRGPVLGGWTPSGPNESLCASIEETRLTADEDLWAAELRLGCHHLIVDRIAQAAARDPHRERLVGLAMTALHRSGRTAEALRLFERSRRSLAEEFGVDPGAALRDLHRVLLGTTPAVTSTVPRLLPSAAPHLIGRDHDVTRTRSLLTTQRSSVRLAVVTGPAGVGKTALSVRVAHDVSQHFPDGQLYADLHGTDRRTAADVLTSFLRALGASRIPADVDERASLYRNLLAGKRVLVVLDNALDAGQVRILIPAAASCAVLLSSRRRLGAALGAASIELDVLGTRPAIELLLTLAGRPPLEQERGAAAEIVRLCDGLPLAIRAVAARLAVKPHWTLAELCTRLADDRKRLDHLIYDGLDVRASILPSFAGLSDDARTLLYRLGGSGSADVDRAESATLLGLDAGDAEEILEELHDARLLDVSAPGSVREPHRYRLPDLVRLVAAEQARLTPSNG